MSQMSPEQSWNAGLYDGKHAFVWQHGESLVGLLDPKPGERVLDLGCGTGHLTARIAEAGAAVLGLDSSGEMLARARAAHPHLEFRQADARDFAVAGPLDAVFSNAVLHWVRPPEAVARRVRDSLRPGGRFVAELGGRGNVRTFQAALGAAAEELGLSLGEPPWYFPGIGEYATVLEAAGLEVRFAVLFDRPTPLEGPDGFRDWVRMFAAWALDKVPPERADEFLRIAEAKARPALFQEGGWVADYRRLRVVAFRV